MSFIKDIPAEQVEKCLRDCQSKLLVQTSDWGVTILQRHAAVFAALGKQAAAGLQKDSDPRDCIGTPPPASEPPELKIELCFDCDNPATIRLCDGGAYCDEHAIARAGKAEANEEKMCQERDEAQAMLDTLASLILEADIDWPDHHAMWFKAIDRATELQARRKKLLREKLDSASSKLISDLEAEIAALKAGPDWKAAHENLGIAHEAALDRAEEAEARIAALESDLKRIAEVGESADWITEAEWKQKDEFFQQAEAQRDEALAELAALKARPDNKTPTKDAVEWVYLLADAVANRAFGDTPHNSAGVFQIVTPHPDTLRLRELGSTPRPNAETLRKARKASRSFRDSLSPGPFVTTNCDAIDAALNAMEDMLAKQEPKRWEMTHAQEQLVSPYGEWPDGGRAVSVALRDTILAVESLQEQVDELRRAK